MSDNELKGKILKVMRDYPVASVATIKDDKPWVRYMATQAEDDLTIYSTSFASARKISQIKADKNVHLAFGADPKNFVLPYIQVEGIAEVSMDLNIKKRCWHEMLEQFFEGPEDPNFVVIIIKPAMIEYIAPNTHSPEVYTPCEA